MGRDYDPQMEAHGNWIRMECLERAVERDKYGRKSPDQLIAEAKHFENYVLNRKPARVIKLVKGKGEKDGR